MGGTWLPLLRRGPKNAARIFQKLRKVERNKPPIQQYLFLIDTLDWISEGQLAQSEDLLENVIESGIHLVLVMALLDKDTYDEKLDYPVIFNRDRFVGMLLAVFNTLPATLFEPSRRNTGAHRFISKVLDQLSTRLWKFIWEKRTILLGRPDDQPPSCFIVLPSHYRSNIEKQMELSIRPLVSFNIPLWRTTYHQFRGIMPDSRYLLRLMLFLWSVLPDDKETQSLEECVEVITFTMQVQGMDPNAQQEAVLDAISACERQDGTNELIRKACYYLGYKRDAIDETLANACGILLAICRMSPQVPQRRQYRSYGVDILDALLKACQRQFCCGVTRQFDFQLSFLSMNITILLLDYAGTVYLKGLRDKVNHLNLLPVLAKGCFHGVLTQNSWSLPTLDRLLDIYLRAISQLSREDSAILRSSKRMFRRIWYPTLQEMLSIPMQTNDKRRGEISKWIEIGRLYDLDVSEEAIERHRFMYRMQLAFTRGQTRRCHWSECLCFDTSHPPHSLRVCRGCESVFYCSTQCQRNDWEDGVHRDECEALRSRRMLVPFRT
ncbi:hypothetical protein K474DRAFT_1663751 [Panus rudis PR-1116 ss-1]|nr:hypothetical protein K474DRAFT_1663751 [Panus rudis PR-1116 ss-1]